MVGLPFRSLSGGCALTCRVPVAAAPFVAPGEPLAPDEHSGVTALPSAAVINRDGTLARAVAGTPGRAAGEESPTLFRGPGCFLVSYQPLASLLRVGF